MASKKKTQTPTAISRPLSTRDWKRFLAELADDKPNPVLVAAMKKYRAKKKT